ncbi:hypothetical protein [Sphingobacterium bovistauri]|uniref:Transmembrane protein n=1 Tax=Sphingobacterium bovistauri TaxID=2781959 RepID=A0ABS7Z4H6_9SPHI|nr:hypothetical protein [Sphingobacterium bovistauri]MCA5003659.1 hypothetical protein [Sphingobacterium bovistauri]
MTLVISTSFYYNQNYIEKYLCVQRSMQNNTCHGQCYLMQKLKKQQEKEQQSFKINFQEGIAVQHQLFSFDINLAVQKSTPQYNLYSTNLNPRDYSFNLYHPPVFG